MSLKIRMGFNNWSTHPVAGPATMGAGAAIVTYLGYKNVETRYQIRINQGLADLDDLNEKTISSYWQRRMKEYVDSFLAKEIAPNIRAECCNQSQLKECNTKLINGISNAASHIALHYYRLDRSSKDRIYGPNNPDEMTALLMNTNWNGPEMYAECLKKACRGQYMKCQKY